MSKKGCTLSTFDTNIVIYSMIPALKFAVELILIVLYDRVIWWFWSYVNKIYTGERDISLVFHTRLIIRAFEAVVRMTTYIEHHSTSTYIFHQCTYSRNGCNALLFSRYRRVSFHVYFKIISMHSFCKDKHPLLIFKRKTEFCRESKWLRWADTSSYPLPRDARNFNRKTGHFMLVGFISRQKE